MGKVRRVLISGASSDIGREIAARLAADGFALALHCHGDGGAAALAALLKTLPAPAPHSVLRFDAADREAAGAAIEADIAANGAYWGIVTCAGVTADGPMPGMPGEDWDRVIRVNLDGFYNVVKPALLPMIRLRAGGRIVAVASVSGVAGNRGQTNYSASKAGVIAACKSLALELAKRNITVNAVSPGLIATKMVTPETLERALPLIPLNRPGTPAEVAALVAFLFGEGAAYITRQNINVNGGMC